MANIDCTVLVEVLKKLSSCDTKEDLWYAIDFPIEFSDSTKSRFFYGLPPNKDRDETDYRAWWPAKNRRDFEKGIRLFFLSFVTEENLSDRRQTVQAVCKKMGVSAPWRDALDQQDTPQKLIDYMMDRAYQEALQHSLPQNKVAPPPGGLPVQGSHPWTHLPYAHAHSPLEEGCLITEPHPSFLPRQSQEDAPFFSQFSTLRAGDRRWRLPYKELFGHPKGGQKEYVEGKNLSFQYEPWTADFRSHVQRLDLAEEVERERQAAEALGYTQHPPKLCLAHYLERKQEDDTGSASFSLELTFGQSGYLEHRVYRRELAQNPEERQAFEALIRLPKGNNPALRHCPWAACGGGTWVVTRDGYLALSLRTNVAEEPGKLSYSSSGSYGRYTTEEGRQRDNTPGLAMCKELVEELGLDQVTPQDLTLISLGIDLNRALIQFSYLMESPLTAEELRYCRADQATTADEQILCFLPLDSPDLALDLLFQAEFEPGAAYSLFRLLQKRFSLP